MTAFWPIIREAKFYQIWDWRWNINNNISFHFRLFPRKTKDKIFQKIQKTLSWGHFGPFLPILGQKWIFLEKRTLSVFRYSDYLPSCRKSEKTIMPFPRKMLNWWTDRKTMIIWYDPPQDGPYVVFFNPTGNLQRLLDWACRIEIVAMYVAAQTICLNQIITTRKKCIW